MILLNLKNFTEISLGLVFLIIIKYII